MMYLSVIEFHCKALCVFHHTNYDMILMKKQEKNADNPIKNLIIVKNEI